MLRIYLFQSWYHNESQPGVILAM